MTAVTVDQTRAGRQGSANGRELGAAVTLKAVELTYGPVRAVNGITLGVRPGEFFTLLGPSGSGKTTTLQMIAGFLTPTSGEIEIDGTCMTRTPPFRRGIGVVFQSYALFPHMTVFDNIAFPLRVRKVPRREIEPRVQEALALVKLPDYGRRRIGQLSGGQQQRVALARAIVFGPRLLLMDEPLGALDAQLRKQMQGELKRLQQRLGLTVVYVTHDQEEALSMSDRIAVMHSGRIEQVGTPEAIYEHPRSRFVADFIGDANVISGTVERYAAGVASIGLGSARVYAATQKCPEVGRPVTIVVRPERLVIDAEPRTPSALSGVVADVFYSGSHAVTVVDSVEGLSLTVKTTNARGDNRRQRGERVVVGWFPEDAVLLAE